MTTPHEPTEGRARLDRIRARVFKAQQADAPYDSHALEDIEWLLDTIEDSWNVCSRPGGCIPGRPW